MVTAKQESEDAQLAAGALPEIDVRRAQLYLTYLKYSPAVVDGLYGKRSRSALIEFRLKNGLGSSDRVDQPVLIAMQSQVRQL